MTTITTQELMDKHIKAVFDNRQYGNIKLVAHCFAAVLQELSDVANTGVNIEITPMSLLGAYDEIEAAYDGKLPKRVLDRAA